MKNQIISTLKRNVTLPVVLMFAIAIFTVSCQKEQLLPNVDQEVELRMAPGSDPIAQIAIDNNFNELVGALVYVDTELNAGLVNMFMNGTDQYTVFAPTDQAFNNLYIALNITDITDLDAVLVLDVLKYHVVEGRRIAKSVVPMKNLRIIQTLLGVPFSVNPSAQIIAVGNTANIIAADISASNGIIHVIDAVILPIQ
jgi:uncharacterized surface protein with fasciclin (FAS1) repeats